MKNRCFKKSGRARSCSNSSKSLFGRWLLKLMLLSTCGSKGRWTYEKVEIDVSSNKLLIVQDGM